MEYEFRIRPNKALALVNLGELWRCRDLLQMLVWRDFAVKYKQTILGPIWFILQPILPALVFTVIFGRVAKMSTDGLPPFLFFLCNQIAWGYFATNFSTVSATLLGNLNIFSKVYFPRLVVPLSSLISTLVTLSIQLVLFFSVYFYYKVSSPQGNALHLSWTLLLLPLCIVHLGAMSLGFGLWMSALTAKYRDLQQLSHVIIQLWMYGSAVIFPLSQVPPQYRTLVSLNPVSFALESTRFSLFGSGTLTWGAGLWSVGVAILVLLSGLWIFNRVSRVYIDFA